MKYAGQLAAVVALCLSTQAWAEEAAKPSAGPEGKTFVGGLFLGGFLASDDHEFYDPDTSMRQGLGAVAGELGLRLAYFPFRYVGVEGEGLVLNATTDEGTGLMWGGRGHVIAQLPTAKITPFVVAGGGVMGVKSSNSNLGTDADRIAYGGVGARYRLKGPWSIRADIRGIGAPKGDSADGWTLHFEGLVGISYDVGGELPTSFKYSIGNNDPDGDGFAGDDDKCPNEKGEAPDGCPQDPDGDGIVGAADSCPQEPETVNSFEDEDGCPDEVPDSDGDGLNDPADKCPNEAEDVDSFEDEDGCPEPDNDGDGVLDGSDDCPDVAGPVENRGCPDSDRDGDGVVDRLDNCPDEPGTEANHGCKKKQAVVIEKDAIKILDKVYFRTGNARIRSRSNQLLRNVAAVLNAHPEISKVQVEGHTDDVGDDEANKVLSMERAEAVVKFLVDAGVAAERLVPMGYGEERPVAEGTSRDARAQNRRVEFNVLERTSVKGQDAPE